MIAIISHDAGGAELLSSFIVANELTGKFLLSGPAIKIFPPCTATQKTGLEQHFNIYSILTI